MQVRVEGPVAEHPNGPYAHVLHAPHVVAEHIVPSVVPRVQPVESMREVGAHAPAAHAKSMHVRDCVPLSVHVSAKPPHAP